MAAYAALVSLMNTMDHIQNHSRLSTSLDKIQVESLREKIGFLLEFIESGSHGCSKEVEVLESQIASAAHAAEDVFESHVVDQIQAGSISLLDLKTVIQVMDSVKETVVNVKEDRGFKDLQPTYPSLAAPTLSKPLMSIRNSTMVGFEDDLLQLMERLTGQQSNLHIIPIVGMGGIGKTTLARNVYENSFIVQHFDIRAWVTVSQEYSVREIILELLFCQRKSTSEMDGKDEDQLGEQLYKSLSGRRYLIVLDDIWSIEAWDKIKRFLPNNSGSRIVVTTRLSDMAIHFGSPSHVMNFLNEDKSWDLFCEKAFAQEGCPLELEEIGKIIVKRCEGLPLSIVVIGGLLRKSDKTQEYWENIAKDKYSTLYSGVDEQSLDILSLSYCHLPVHLKPCFLYTGIFPEDREIHVSQLIKLWVAEGFLKPNRTQSLEEIAEGYLKDLVDRNLILVSGKRYGKILTCKVHDLLRDLCLKVAQKEKFLCVMRVCDIPQGIDTEGCTVFHERIAKKKYPSYMFNSLELAPVTRSSVSNGVGLRLSFKFKLFGVLNMFNMDSLGDVFKQANWRYVCASYTGISVPCHRLPASVLQLWNLQTLIISTKELVVLPSEIWSMPQLRHLELHQMYLPEPPLSDQQDDEFVLQNLQTLKKVVNFRWTEEVCKRIPNIRKLHIRYNGLPEECEGSSHDYCLYNLGSLHKLESLDCCFNESRNWGDLRQGLTFSSSLQKLSLTNCNLRWEDLTMIGSLPYLEVLNLGWKTVSGNEWNPVEGEFVRLKYLKIYYCSDLIYWNADRSHFPILESLVLEGFPELDEIPLDFGEIPTLHTIDVINCSEYVGISAMKILEEQESLGNEGLQVRIKFFGMDSRLVRFRKKVELFESYTSTNLNLETSCGVQ